jgi:hypothetical protein
VSVILDRLVHVADRRPRAPAAICGNTVHAPVPRSAAPISATRRPSSYRVVAAGWAIHMVGYTEEATAVPISHEPSRHTHGRRKPQE